jgi:hypothetical protein
MVPERANQNEDDETRGGDPELVAEHDPNYPR